MVDLVAFLNARLDERAAKARAAMNGGEGRWTQVNPELEPGRIEDERGEPIVYDETLRPTEGQAAHIAENDPARVLAEVERDRRILTEVVPEVQGMVDQIDQEFGSTTVEKKLRGAGVPAPTPTDVRLLRLLALPYADHPDYLAKWKP